MANVFSKMYLVPEDSMNKLRDEIRLDSVLDSKMQKIIKLKKIDDAKKWYLYRQLLMKYANTNRLRKNNSNKIVNSKSDHAAQTEYIPKLPDNMNDSAREEIENLSMLRTPEPFRKRAFTFRPSIDGRPSMDRNRLSTTGLFNTSIFTDDEGEEPVHKVSSSENEFFSPVTTQKKEPRRRSKGMRQENILNESVKRRSTPILTDFFKKTKRAATTVPEIPPFKKQKGQGQKRFKWTSMR